MISQALANLVENADQIRQAGRRPLQPLGADAVTASREILIEARREGDSVLLSVTDHGPGIPEADRKHAVERFVRLEASRTLPGSGLGLSLASARSRPCMAASSGSATRIRALWRRSRSRRAPVGDRLAAQTPDVPQKVA